MLYKNFLDSQVKYQLCTGQRKECKANAGTMASHKQTNTTKRFPRYHIAKPFGCEQAISLILNPPGSSWIFTSNVLEDKSRWGSDPY